MIAWLKTHARLAAVVVAAVILVAIADAALPQWIQGEKPMATPTATREAAIPQLTTQPPAVVETATFAMG
jgi:anti-sigma-K factor RskA